MNYYRSFCGVPGYKLQVTGTFPVPGFREIQTLGTWNLKLGTWYLVTKKAPLLAEECF